MTDIQAPSFSPPVELRFRRGAMVAGPWPDALPLPPGCRWHEVLGRPTLLAPACLHAALCRVLRDSGTPFVDRAEAPAPLPAGATLPEPKPAVAMGLHAFRAHGGRGLMLGLDDADRTATAVYALREAGRTSLVLAPAEAGAAGWLAALQPWFGHGVGPLRHDVRAPQVAVASWSAFMPRASEHGDRFALLVADGCDRVPSGPAFAALQ